MFVKSKVEPLLPTLTEICAGLACYGFLNLVKENDFLPHILSKWIVHVDIRNTYEGCKAKVQ